MWVTGSGFPSSWKRGRVPSAGSYFMSQNLMILNRRHLFLTILLVAGQLFLTGMAYLGLDNIARNYRSAACQSGLGGFSLMSGTWLNVN